MSIILVFLSLFWQPHAPVIISCRQAVIWTDYDCQYPMMWGGGKVYIQQERIRNGKLQYNIYKERQ
jgi:hypothetical protein